MKLNSTTVHINTTWSWTELNSTVQLKTTQLTGIKVNYNVEHKRTLIKSNTALNLCKQIWFLLKTIHHNWNLLSETQLNFKSYQQNLTLNWIKLNFSKEIDSTHASQNQVNHNWTLIKSNIAISICKETWILLKPIHQN